MKLPQFISTGQLAVLTGKSRRAITEAVRNEQLEAIEAGGMYLIPVAAVRDYLERKDK